jgi:tRNA (adenine57-N1/adenine58-N1)-methyltransferase
MKFITYYSGKKYILHDQTMHIEPGAIKREQLTKAGVVVSTSKKENLTLIQPGFKDVYVSMKRGAQAINLKDCGIILAETLVGKESVCLDCGSGMGGLTCFLARYVKKVHSWDNREEHLITAKKNAEKLGLKNVLFKNHDIHKGIPKKNLDLITIDVRNPELVVPFFPKALALGGRFVFYCPQITQVHEVTIAVAKESALLVESVQEIIIRNWKSEGQILRPEHMGLMHTGFLVFGRRIA